MASFPPLITQTDIELDVGPGTLAQFTDDDGDGRADSAAVDRIIAIASKEGGGILRGAWELEGVVALVAEDEKVQHEIVMLAMRAAGQRRPALRDERGRMMYALEGEAAEKFLEKLRDTQRRVGSEGGTVENNPRVNFKTNFDRPKTKTFAPTRGNPNAGGGF